MPSSFHRTFQTFIDCLADSGDQRGLHEAMTKAAAALDLQCFAYLTLPGKSGDSPRLISNYPVAWTGHYLRQRYERLDPVIVEAVARTEPFEWGIDNGHLFLSKAQKDLFEEAAAFGIRCGFTVPIHDGRGPVAAVGRMTFGISL
jgi:LuxR family transcriptional regulator, activator of conjugal transfer of Ti plasmids